MEELILVEEVPDISYKDIGGLSGQIEQIRDAIELPDLHADLFRSTSSSRRRGSRSRPARLRQDADRQGGGELAGQAGRGQDGTGRGDQGGKKSFFLNIKGPSC